MSEKYNSIRWFLRELPRLRESEIIDDETLIIGSMNFTKQGENVNDENSLIIKSSILTPAYKAHFLDLWKSIKE